MRFHSAFLLVAGITVPTVAFALTIQPSDFYTDVRAGSREAAGINLLTREGIVHGYGNGFFGVSRAINRAEFLKIAMRSVPGGGDTFAPANCFPDVRTNHWFSPFVCAAKARGIVKGINDGLFHPDDTVTYGEALKALVLGFYCTSFDHCSLSLDRERKGSEHWAEPYYRAARAKGVDLSVTITLDTPLKRGLAARLTAAFLAESKGQLAEFRLAEAGQYAFLSSSSSFSSSMRSSSRSSSSSSASSVSGPVDSLTDTQARSQFLLLGETGPMLGAGKIFLEVEPLEVTSITVNIGIESSTVQALLVYDDRRQLIGRANLDPTASSNRSYKVELPAGRLTVGKREERTIYVRPVLLSRDGGGQSNQIVQISNIVVKGTGEWSNQAYTSQVTGTNAYPVFRTARSAITTVMNAGPSTSTLILGTNRVIGSFTISGRSSDSTAHLDISTLVFTIAQSGGVGITNATLGVEGISEKFPCTANASTITCTGIPDSYGSATDGPRTFTVYGTSTATDLSHASLQLFINDFGESTRAGDITWSDGTNTFTWVALPSGALSADSTRYQY